MFSGQRNSDRDFDKDKLHPSYATKPLSVWQLQQQQSVMADGISRGVKMSTVQETMPQPVPTTWQAIYDPSNPQADWGGNVTRDIGGKAHYINHRSQENGIEKTEEGLVSREERKEWTSRRRGEGFNARNSTPGLLGGIGLSASDDRFKTTSQALGNGEGTSREQMILKKRMLPVKMVPNPAQSQSNSRVGSRANSRGDGGGGDYENQCYSEQNTPRSEQEQYQQQQNHNNSNSQYSEQSLVGYRAPAQTKSFINNLGASIASSLNQPVPKLTNPNPKNLETVNRPIPGYTGYRQNN